MSKQHPMEEIAELVNLAYVYAQDGALLTASKKLLEASQKMEAHALNCLAEENALVPSDS